MPSRSLVNTTRARSPLLKVGVVVAAIAVGGMVAVFQRRSSPTYLSPEAGGEPAGLANDGKSRRKPPVFKLGPPELAAGGGSQRYVVPEKAVDPDRLDELNARKRRAEALLNAPEQLTASIPKALAYKIDRELGLGSVRMFNLERRNEVWAPAMEQQVRDSFSPDALSQFPGLNLEVECRASTCRLTLDAPKELVDQYSKFYMPWQRRLAILDQLFKDRGVLGVSQRETLESDTRTTVTFTHDPGSIDPAQYQQWSNQAREAIFKMSRQ